MEKQIPQNCNQCPNACPRDALKCGRGKAYFQRLESGEEQRESSNPLTKLLCQCGQIASHKSEMMQIHNVDEENMFSGLEKEEREQLQALLTKLKRCWEEEHAKRHGQGGHGHGMHHHGQETRE